MIAATFLFLVFVGEIVLLGLLGGHALFGGVDPVVYITSNIASSLVALGFSVLAIYGIAKSYAFKVGVIFAIIILGVLIAVTGGV